MEAGQLNPPIHSELLEPFFAAVIARWGMQCINAKKAADALPDDDTSYLADQIRWRVEDTCRNAWWGIRALNRVVLACPDAHHAAIAIGNEKSRFSDLIESLIGVNPIMEWKI